MRRRRFLALAGTALAAGCSGSPDGDPTTATPTERTAASPRGRVTSARPPPDTIYVATDGRPSNRGTREAPVGSIQAAVERAGPGQTVHVLPGRYREDVETARDGAPGAPITITGPPEATYVGGTGHPYAAPLRIKHSHVHVTGLTFDGLQAPDRADERLAYAAANVQIRPEYDGAGEPERLRDVKVTPHAVGNTRGNCVHVFSAEDVEVGEFQVIGPAGIDHFVFAEPGHDGEIVYVGSAPNGWRKHFGGHVDRPRNVHVHHIDNSAGHVHSEIADAKVGTEDVLVEYCTSVGAVSDPRTGGGAGLHLGGVNGVARWNVIERSSPTGILVGNWGKTYEQVPEAGTNNSVYGNRVTGTFEKFTEVNSEVKAIAITDDVSEADMGHYCGNEVDGPVDGEPGGPCPDDLPAGDGVGHLGGETPFS